MRKKILLLALVLTLPVSASGGVVSMSNKYCNLQGTQKISESYNNINTGFDQVENDIEENKTKIHNHINGVSDRHDAEVITYSGIVPGATNVKQAIDNLRNRVEEIITTPAEGVSAQEIIDARGGEISLGGRLDKFDSQLAEKVTKQELENSISMYWIPPQQPPARIDIEGWFADGYNWTADDYINNLIEPLRQQDTNYITRTSLGKDASGIYDVWRYIFTPTNYKKTVIIGTGIHGGEITPVLATYRFLYHLVNDWNQSPQLQYIRNNVRIVWIPFQNPWGFTPPRSRKNYNGVDINRNFDYKWDEYATLGKQPTDPDYQGTEPFSEPETQYIRDTLLEFDDATVYLDLHNLGTPTADCVIYNSANAPNKFIFDDLANWFCRDLSEPDIIYGTLENPSSYNYALKVLGIASGNPEFPDGRFGEKVYDSTEMTKAVEWFGNLILQHAREDVFLAEEPFVINNYYTATGVYNIALNVGSYASIPAFDFEFNIPCEGLIIFDGTVTIKGSDTASQNFICPRIGQYGTNIVPTTLYPTWYEVYNEGDKRSTLSFHAATYVRRTDASKGIGKATVGISGYTQTGTCIIYRYRGRIIFIPSNKISRFQVWSASETGNMDTRIY